VQFWNALVSGRAIVLMRNFDPREALDIVAQRRITHWSALPDTFLSLQALGAEAVRNADTSSLQELEIGGAAAPTALKTWLAGIFGSVLSEAYGTTETGRISTMPLARLSEKPGSCGRPARGVTVEIRDADGASLTAGAIGEIWARTPRTLECDLPNATRIRRDADGFVATGDAGRIDSDGFIYITGKASDLLESDMRHTG
jgi:long-chain acyl-CoA synthetase